MVTLSLCGCFEHCVELSLDKGIMLTCYKGPVRSYVAEVCGYVCRVHVLET